MSQLVRSSTTRSALVWNNRLRPSYYETLKARSERVHLRSLSCSSSALINNSFLPLDLLGVNGYPAAPSTLGGVRFASGGTKGARGHGWYHKYKEGKGGRHLQGEWWDRDVEHLEHINAQVLSYGSDKVWFTFRVGNVSDDAGADDGVVVESAQQAEEEAVTSASAEDSEAAKADEGTEGEEKSSEPPEGEDDTSSTSTKTAPTGVKYYRLEVEVATVALPNIVDNFLKLVRGGYYTNTSIYRTEKNVGALIGDQVANPQYHRDEDKSSSPHPPFLYARCHPNAKGKLVTNLVHVGEDTMAMSHTPGTLCMLQPRVLEVDSRVMFIRENDCPHLDGRHVCFGRLTPESLETLQTMMDSVFTQKGVPTIDMTIVECGVVGDAPDEAETPVAA